MPAIYDLANRGLLPPGFSLVGFARRDWADEDFAQVVHDSVKEHARTEFREEVWQQLAEGFRFVPGDFDDDVAFDHLRRTIEELDEVRGTGGNHAFYLSIPPRFFGDVIGQLKEHGLADPGARHLAPGRGGEAVRPRPGAARELNATIAEVFPPESVFRIDHYLGKETVQNILAMRFANTMFEPIWNSNYVDHVQITMAEDIGIGGRAGYYDGIGAARDVIQNHLMQLMALVAMEEPTSFDAREPADREAEGALRRSCSPGGSTCTTARGQYAAGWAGRREGASASSRRRASRRTRPPRRTPRSRSTSTPGAGPACRSTCAPASGSAGASPRSRWSSSGRRTCRSRDTATEELTHNALVIRIQPDEGITIRFGSKVPGTAMEIRDVNMDFAYGGSFTESSPEAYERLILDVLLGDPPLFPQHEEVELSWQILDPILDYWAKHGQPEHLRVRHLGSGVRRRDAGPRRPRLEA